MFRRLLLLQLLGTIFILLVVHSIPHCHGLFGERLKVGHQLGLHSSFMAWTDLVDDDVVFEIMTGHHQRLQVLNLLKLVLRCRMVLHLAARKRQGLSTGRLHWPPA